MYIIKDTFTKKYKLKISDTESRKLLAKIGKDCPLFLNKKVKLIKWNL